MSEKEGNKKIKKEGAFAMTVSLYLHFFCWAGFEPAFLPLQMDLYDFPCSEVHNSVKTDPNSTAKPLFLPQAVLPSKLILWGHVYFCLPIDGRRAAYAM